jgi:hypothetical protein
MAGVATNPPGSAPVRTRLVTRRLVALALAGALLALLLIGARSASPPAARAQLSCPALPQGLSPTGPAATRFTMMIRINSQGNVDTYTKPEGGMGGRIRPQDIFVLNTRFEGSASFPEMRPDVAAHLARDLHNTFPCNRIIALNGMSFDPSSLGYAFSLIDDPAIFALLTDYEQGDWNAGRPTDPTRPLWTDKFKLAFPRLRSWNFGFASTVAANPAGAAKRTGLASQDDASWNYGQVAQNLDKQNARLGAPRIGPLTLQTQDSCSDGAAAGFGARAKQLRLQYTFKFITKKVKVEGQKKKRKVTKRIPLKKEGKPLLSNLGLEISFTETPDATDNHAILSTSAAQAAACVPPALKQGVGAFFFFASDDAMRLLFQQPPIAALRPAGSSAGQTTGGVHP